MNLNKNPRFAVEGSQKYTRDDIDRIFTEAQGRWSYILNSLGINLTYLKNKHGPCPLLTCGGKDRFRFDDKDGKGTFYCTHCGAGYGTKLLQLYHGWSFQEAIDRVARLLRIRIASYQAPNIKRANQYVANTNISQQLSKEESTRRIKLFESTWQASLPVSRGDPVDEYLQNRRIKLNSFPSSLRYCPSLEYYEDGKLIDYYQGMIALVTNQNNQVVSIHRTFIKDGYKAKVNSPKKLMQAIHDGATKGAGIKIFYPVNDILGISEGIETGLAFNIAMQIPVWSACNALGMKTIIIPPSVNNIIILADNDASHTGEISAKILSKRLLREGRKVKILIPATIGHDFNDMLLQETSL